MVFQHGRNLGLLVMGYLMESVSSVLVVEQFA